MVGYTLWGFVTIYLFCTFVGFVILIVKIFFNELFGEESNLWGLLSIVGAIFLKIAENFIAAKHIFTLRNSKKLALDNFRAFNVFIFFNLFFDCFMGFLNAMLRVVLAVLASIFFMPSKYTLISR